MQNDRALETRLLRLLDTGASPITTDEILERAASPAVHVPTRRDAHRTDLRFHRPSRIVDSGMMSPPIWPRSAENV